MDSTYSWTSEREAQKPQANREELVERIMRALPDDGTAEPLQGLLLSRASSPTGLGHSVFFPAFCVIAQGRKEILLGDSLYWYDSAHYLIATAELPIASWITEASPERPYLNVILKLDSRLVSSVMVEAGQGAPHSQSLVTAIDVSPLDAGLLDAVVRLIKLLDSPSDARFLAPLVTREIVYRLLKGAQRGRLAHIAALGSNTQRITEAIKRLREEFNRPLRCRAPGRPPRSLRPPPRARGASRLPVAGYRRERSRSCLSRRHRRPRLHNDVSRPSMRGGFVQHDNLTRPSYHNRLHS
jgi:AraC-type transcriptional regulator N-terminus